LIGNRAALRLVIGLAGKQEAGMESYVLGFVTVLASMLIVGYLAYERGWSRSRWVLTASAIGPFAIPLLYLVEAASALRKMMKAPSS
jgi:hypothetical protein